MIQSVAPSIGIDARPISVHGDIERIIAGFARAPNGGLMVTASPPTATTTRIELITTLAAKHKLPVIAPFKRLELRKVRSCNTSRPQFLSPTEQVIDGFRYFGYVPPEGMTDAEMARSFSQRKMSAKRWKMAPKRYSLSR